MDYKNVLVMDIDKIIHGGNKEKDFYRDLIRSYEDHMHDLLDQDPAADLIESHEYKAHLEKLMVSK